MNRFSRFSRMSPPELYRESERLAWYSALQLLVLFCLLAVGALFVPAPGRSVAGNGNACFDGFVVEETEMVAEKEPSDALLPPPLPAVELQPEVACTADAPQPQAVAELPWEAPEVEADAPMLFCDLPESIESPLPRPLRRSAASSPVETKEARSRSATKGAAAKGALTAAAYRHAPRPPYPPSLLNRRVQGRVGLRIVVDARGVPQEVSITSPSGYTAFDRCAREWVLAQWRFHPARLDGAPVASAVRTVVEFVLR